MPDAGVGDQAFPVLTTAPTAAVTAKDGAVPATAGAFTTVSQQPRRIGGQFEVRYEDLARLEGMEVAVRRALMENAASILDNEILNGGAAAYGTDGEIRGLLVQLGAATDPATGEETWERYHTALTSHVSDPWATSMSDIKALVSTGTYKHMASKFRGSDTNEDFPTYWNRTGGGVRLSGKIPAPASGHIHEAVICRANPAMDQAAVMPVWSGFSMQVRDIYTKAATGIVTFTTHMLIGDVVLLRPDVYQRDSFRLA